MSVRVFASILLVVFAPVALGAATLATITTWSSSAVAAGEDDPTLKAARARFQEGVDFYDKGQYEQARAAFLQAYALRKHPAVLLNLAQSCLRSNHPLEAAKYFQQYQRESTTSTAAQKAPTRSEGSPRRGRRSGRDRGLGAPGGRRLRRRRSRRESAPLTDAVDVEPGSHKVKVNGDELKVDVAAGQKVSAKFDTKGAQPVVAPPPPPPAASATPSASSTATEPPPPPPPDQTPKKGLPMWPAFVGGAIAIVGFGTAIGMLGAKGARREAARQRARRDRGATGARPCGCTDPTQQAKFGQALLRALSDDDDKGRHTATRRSETSAFPASASPKKPRSPRCGSSSRRARSSKPAADSDVKTSFDVPLFAPMVGPRANGLTMQAAF